MNIKKRRQIPKKKYSLSSNVFPYQWDTLYMQFQINLGPIVCFELAQAASKIVALRLGCDGNVAYFVKPQWDEIIF